MLYIDNGYNLVIYFYTGINGKTFRKYYKRKGKCNTEIHGRKYPSQFKGVVVRSSKKREARHYINRKYMVKEEIN